MAQTINPTRMELYRLKKRLTVAKRGHKLLKDKQDEMIRRFMELIKENRSLRLDVEKALAKIMAQFDSAKLQLSRAGLLEALMVPSREVTLETGSDSIMNIKTPTLSYQESTSIDLTYSFAFTPSDLDGAVIGLSGILHRLIDLSVIEKTCEMLAREIEKTRRRVNAIEFIMIPDIEDTIKRITNKLEDNERGNITRLMKSKEIIMAKKAQ
ncbi:MAG: V-type ATP synthase subunit D [Acholeplasmataceae bacterium]|nr:V-type ATP synthase subunit D [Acholeplasmataceae bacterium]